MTDYRYSREFAELLDSVTAKRPKTVIDHIREHGQITTEELKDTYGYNHPPRAIRDVREHGIPIDTFRVHGSDGRQIGAYKFGDPGKVRATKLSGRTVFSANLKAELIDRFGARCNIYLKEFPAGDLQIDHRVPFEIAGDNGPLSENTEEYMLLCASANRAKSWACEHCPNWQTKDPEVCRSCYWARPESYTHVATRDVRRLDVVWTESEVQDYDVLVQAAGEIHEEAPEYVKRVLRRHFRQDES